MTINIIVNLTIDATGVVALRMFSCVCSRSQKGKSLCANLTYTKFHSMADFDVDGIPVPVAVPAQPPIPQVPHVPQVAQVPQVPQANLTPVASMMSIVVCSGAQTYLRQSRELVCVFVAWGVGTYIETFDGTTTELHTVSPSLCVVKHLRSKVKQS